MGKVKHHLAWDGIEAAKAAEEFGDLPDRLNTLIVEHLRCEAKFTWDASLRNDLGADSLDSVELAMAIEEEFGFRVSDAAADRWRTPGDLLETVRGGIQ